MPCLDGPSTLAALRANERCRGIPVIFLTARADPKKWEDCVGLGALAVMAKPFDPTALPAELTQVLAER